MNKKSLNLLKKLCEAHSTPGDEKEIADILKKRWMKAGWTVNTHGTYAVSAGKRTCRNGKHPRLLICAHMDSPGFITDRHSWNFFKQKNTAQIHIVPLGHPCFEEDSAKGKLKCRNGIFSGIIHKTISDKETSYFFEMPLAEAENADLSIGDRICYETDFSVEDNLIHAPFLDNRIGCWMLNRLAELKPGWNKRCDIILGAAGSEEMTGFGAMVLAAEVKAELVIVLDATYEAEEQNVLIGKGPAVTLSDNSVLLSPHRRDRIRQIMMKAGVPLQFEAYNYSGTDASAFPRQGCTATVIPLLIPTRGNHSPVETADINDLMNWEKAVRALENKWKSVY
ncbi:MAG: hypothetical protein R6V06_01445 [Kiritimatiellia bacterium]